MLHSELENPDSRSMNSLWSEGLSYGWENVLLQIIQYVRLAL